jgi:hypothetical protein
VETTCSCSETHQAGESAPAVALNPADVVSEQCTADQQDTLHQHQERLARKQARHTAAAWDKI